MRMHELHGLCDIVFYKDLANNGSLVAIVTTEVFHGFNLHVCGCSLVLVRHLAGDAGISRFSFDDACADLIAWAQPEQRMRELHRLCERVA